MRLPQSDRPLVSIVVLLRAGAGLAERALGAIAAAHDPKIPAEVVTVVNTVDPATRRLVTDEQIGARPILRDVNTGTAPGWNLGFEAARGRYVALLHEDSAPEPDWLRPLVTALEEHPHAATAGSRLLHPDGRVQGGGIIAWRDGDVTWIRPDNAPGTMSGDEPYAISHASSAAMLVDREAWSAVGGFDERYFPAFRVEVDFGLALWSMGRAAISVPISLVRHDLGAMHQGDFDPLKSKAFRWFLQERNRQRFLEKWSANLSLLAPLPEGPRNTADAVEPVLARLQERAERPAPAALEVAARPFTGPGVSDMDRRLEAAHREVRDEFFSWLVVDLKRAREELDRERAEARRRSGVIERARADASVRAAEAQRTEQRIEELEAAVKDWGPQIGRRFRKLLRTWMTR
ncbi:MAG TPA: glycosyltransferase [Actinomycetota bacterium]|nr:glycosyltransferase [Actinomycetota bacterium]